ncbi:hypothetical protein [Marinococcus sp. PL1-022]|uniref:hypothetical protein n=1 Tax=Marinococcus sp. PL1-022 TaxID=3095363 RepID=UPI0029C4072A|nr:hypothetical protein [Marinococcus sp. PL1-022]MDX6151592.1 hypothetical protein [Marinococcus sp. PL1-022]
MSLSKQAEEYFREVGDYLYLYGRKTEDIELSIQPDKEAVEVQEEAGGSMYEIVSKEPRVYSQAIKKQVSPSTGEHISFLILVAWILFSALWSWDLLRGMTVFSIWYFGILGPGALIISFLMIYGRSIQAFHSNRMKQVLNYLPQAAMLVLVIPVRDLITNVPEGGLVLPAAFKWWFVPAAIMATALAVRILQKSFLPVYAVIMASLIMVWLVISAVDLLPFPHNLITYIVLVGAAFAYGVIMNLKPEREKS